MSANCLLEIIPADLLDTLYTGLRKVMENTLEWCVVTVNKPHMFEVEICTGLLRGCRSYPIPNAVIPIPVPVSYTHLTLPTNREV